MAAEKQTPPESPLDIPRTGRIGRFTKILEKKVGPELLVTIMAGASEYSSFKPEKKAAWWKQTVETLENELGKEKAVAVMNACGSKCCGTGQRKTAVKLMQESSSTEEFLQKVAEYGVKDGEIEYQLVNDHTIIGKHNRCFCGQVKKLTENFKNDTYCQCSVEFNRQFFMAAFNKPIEVELKQSILTGGEFCEFLITVKE